MSNFFLSSTERVSPPENTPLRLSSGPDFEFDPELGLFSGYTAGTITLRCSSTADSSKYDDLVRDYYFKIDNLSAAYFDVNNLKVVNDSFGHAIGDKLIKHVSDAVMRHADDERRKVFRMGGDEFLILIENPEPGEADSIVKSVYDELKSRNDSSQYPVSCSAGVAIGKGTDVVSVVKLADSRMYAYKKAMRADRED